MILKIARAKQTGGEAASDRNRCEEKVERRRKRDKICPSGRTVFICVMRGVPTIQTQSTPCSHYFPPPVPCPWWLERRRRRCEEVQRFVNGPGDDVSTGLVLVLDIVSERDPNIQNPKRVPGLLGQGDREPHDLDAVVRPSSLGERGITCSSGATAVILDAGSSPSLMNTIVPAVA